MTRRFLAAFFVITLLCQAQDSQQKKPQEQEPPEEDESINKPQKEYILNPLQAENEIKVGNFYLKRGSYKAAARRFEEATRWNPGSSEAFLKLGEALEKNGNRSASLKAYTKYLELEPDGKNSESIRKKVHEK